jgi:Protein of unknown function (DUF4232)
MPAVSLIALVLVAAGCGGRQAPPRVVSWVDDPLPAYRTPSAQLVRYPASAPPCDASQLRLRNGRTGAGLGHYLEELDIENIGDRPCLVRGYPTLTALDARGARVSLEPQRGGTYFGQLLPADIAPGGRVHLDFDTTSACQGGRAPTVRYHAVTLELPQGGTLRGPGTSLVDQCGLTMSQVGLPMRYAPPPVAPGSPGTLRARIVLPRTAQRGGLLRFTVVLRNPTARRVTLAPCPGYTESLFAQQAFVRRTLRLNCKQVTELAPRAQQRYAMQLRVPRGASGFAKVGWSLDTANGPFAGGVVQIP